MNHLFPPPLRGRPAQPVDAFIERPGADAGASSTGKAKEQSDASRPDGSGERR